MENIIDQSVKKAAENKLSSAFKSRKARKDYKEAQKTYDPAQHQEKIRDTRKEYTRIITMSNYIPNNEHFFKKRA